MIRQQICVITLVLACPVIAQPVLLGVENTPVFTGSQTQWHGLDQIKFEVDGAAAYVVTPKKPLPGNPWIWRARFPDYHPEMDIELVKQGFHIGYIDVAGLFGNREAIARGEKFYDFVVEKGLSKRPAMEGVSRGGLFVYNWTAKYPERVACIYCDTPVLDFKSWPGGLGEGKGSPRDWEHCKIAYGLTEDEALAFRGNPIDHAESIAQAKIPVMHIVSDSDTIVPPKENTDILHARLKAAGHDMQVIRVAEGTAVSNGHHFTHPEPQRVVEFIKQHASGN